MNDLSGRQLLITSGPTRAPIDAVRYLSNTSSGKLGAMIAEEALRRGAAVTFIYGHRSMVPTASGLGNGHHRRLRLIEVDTVDDAAAALERELRGGPHDGIIHAMAVLDYVPAERMLGKVRSGEEDWIIRLVPTVKVIKMIKEIAHDAVLVAFKLEVGVPYQELIASASALMASTDADLVVANDLMEITAQGHVAHIVGVEGAVEATTHAKGELAEVILDKLGALLRERVESRETEEPMREM